MQRLYYSGAPVDLLLVDNELKRTQEIDIVGGTSSLIALAKTVVSDAFVPDYTKIIYEKFLSRQLIRLNADVTKTAYDDIDDIFQLIEQTSEAYYKLTAGSLQHEPKDAGKIYELLREEKLLQKEAANDINGIDTSFTELNGLTNGWQKTDLTIIAARPSGGKTAFSLALALAAVNAMAPTLIFSLKMSDKQLGERMISCISELELSRVRRPNEMSKQEWGRFEHYGKIFRDYPLYIDDTAGINLFNMRAKVRRMRMKYGIQLVIVDYLQLMTGVGNEGNREQEISRISRGLKAIAKDFDIPVIALSQLSRSIENGAGEATRDPRLSDLRESGAIEQDADNVIFITNPGADMINENPYYFGKKFITIAKGRNIGLGRVCLEFNSDIQRWRTPDVF